MTVFNTTTWHFQSLRRGLLLGACSLLAAGSVLAQADWPAGRGITWVVPYPAGGAADTVARAVSVREALLVRVNDNQFSAMVSLCYNIGVVAFANSSVLRFANEGRLEEAAASFALWNKAAGQVLRGLVRRRAAEAELFSMAQA